MKHGFEARYGNLSGLQYSEHTSGKTNGNSRLTSWVWSILASFGIFGGISTLFVGLIFVVIHGFLYSDLIFDRLGTGLLIAAIPMILLGSICLDEIEGKK